MLRRLAPETPLPAEKEKRKKREPKKEETTNASMMKREKQGQLQQRNMFMNDFVCKQLEADASVPKSWVAFARAAAQGKDAAVIEASTCLDDAEDEFKYFKSRRKTTATTTTSSKKKKNNENEDEDEDEENEAGVEDQNGVFIDAACRRARYSKSDETERGFDSTEPFRGVVGMHRGGCARSRTTNLAY